MGERWGEWPISQSRFHHFPGGRRSSPPSPLQNRPFCHSPTGSSFSSPNALGTTQQGPVSGTTSGKANRGCVVHVVCAAPSTSTVFRKGDGIVTGAGPKRRGRGRLVGPCARVQSEPCCGMLRTPFRWTQWGPGWRRGFAPRCGRRTDRSAGAHSRSDPIGPTEALGARVVTDDGPSARAISLSVCHRPSIERACSGTCPDAPRPAHA